MPDFVLDYRPLWAVLITLVAAGLILVTGRWPNLREAVTGAAALGKFAIVVSMLPAVLSGQVLETVPLNLVSGLTLHLRVDPFGLLFALVASGLWMVTSMYSVGYMRTLGYGHQTGYFASFAVCLSATMGIAFAANLITFVIFYEILTIATYPLVIHMRTPEAISGGRKYLAYTLIAGQFLVVAVIWTHLIAPGAGFQPGGFLAGKASAAVLQVLFFFFIVGTGVKAAIMPLHGWLPTAMVAPTPVSALLHAVAVVKAGAFGVIRVVGYVYGPQLLGDIGLGTVLAWLAGFTIIVASVLALAEGNLKRRLAFSTVGQLSYVVLGGALGHPVALLGGIFHIVAHAFMKITLFFCAGAIYATTHKEKVSEMDGLGRQMPVTMGAFTLGSIGIVGGPLIVGFVSKWHLLVGAAKGGQEVFILVLAASALLTTGYFFPVVYRAYFGQPEEGGRVREAVPFLLIPLGVTALLSVVLGVFSNIGLNFFQLATMAATSIVSGGVGPAGGIQ